MTDGKCPDIDHLTAFAQGLLGTDEASQVERHLELCAECRGKLSELSSLSEALSEALFSDEPPALGSELFDRVKGLIPPMMEVARVARKLIPDAVRTAAELIAPPFGPVVARGAASPEAQSLYRAGDVEVAISVKKLGRRKRWAIFGDIFGDGKVSSVELVRSDSDEVMAEAGLNEEGEFHFEDVAPGRYSVVLRVGEKLFEIGGIDCG